MKQAAALQANPAAVRRNKVKTFFSKPHNVILLLMGIVLTITTVAPIIAIVQDTFKIHPGTIDAYLAGTSQGYTLVNYTDLFTSPLAKANLWTPLLNTVLLSVGSCIVAILFGGVFAFLITRTNLSCRKYLSSIFIFPYIMPQWTLAVVWQNLFNSNAVTGTSNGLLTSLFNVQMPLWWCKGLFPSLIVLGMHYAPFAYILIGGILRNMDANLEEAATILKTPRWRIISRITMPIVKPAMLSTFLLVFASSMSAYAVPVFLGSPVRYYVLSTKMKSLMDTYSGQAYIIAAVMIIFGVAILMLNQRVTNSRKQFTTVTGKSSQISLINLRRANRPIAIILVVLLLLVAVLPLLTFAMESVIIKAGDYSLSNMTLDFWVGRNLDYLDQGDSTGILFSAKVWKALGYSLLLAVTCSVVAGTSGILVGYGVAKRRGSRLASWVNSLSFFPYLMPSLAFGAIYLSMSSHVAWLRGFALLALVGSVKYLPFASRSGVNAMLQLSGEIEEAALITGVPWWKRMVRVIFPIQKSSFLSGYLLPMVSCMRELSLFVLLVPTSNTILTTMLMQYSEKGWAQFGNAINLLIIVVVLLVNLTVNKLTGASIDKGVGG